MQCSKQFSLTVTDSDCPDWSTIVWDVANYFEDSSGTASGGTVSCSATGDPLGMFSSGLELHGSIIHTGGVCNGNVAVTITSFSASNLPSFSLAITQDSVPVLAIGLSSLTGPVTNFPFVLADGVGSLIEIFGDDGLNLCVLAVAAGTPPPPPEGQITISFTIT